ncbi:MAG: MoaD/ThiS family protein [Nevskiales bacterium]
MQIRFELHGVLTRLAGTDLIELQCPAPATVDKALDMLIASHPALEAELQRTACAIGEALVSRDTVLDTDSKIALIPPVSGG